jgi:bifunctional UDP-N-acetylglucosamine pyrophosphorylase/glucosamine-1-phosphate N-acetyltransferase
MVAWPVLAAREAGAGRVLVVASPDRDISSGLPEGAETVVQARPDGTGGAIRAAMESLGNGDTGGEVLILSGDHPLINADLIRSLLESHRSGDAAATLMTVELDDPGAYGRVVRDSNGDIAEIVETKDPTRATPDQLAIREVNVGTYVFRHGPLADALQRIGNDNEAGEYRIGDVLPLLREQGLRTVPLKVSDPHANLGVNTRADLALVEREARRLICERHMLAGVRIADPAAAWIDADVEIGPDATIEPGTVLRGATRIAAGATIGPHSTLADTTVGEGASVVHTHATEAEVGPRCAVGPFAHLRPGTVLDAEVKVGAWVEIKNSRIGAGAKVPHLSYVGDADVGAGANLGASTITANYDGFAKHRTKIGQRAHTGVHTSLVAPVSIGDDAYTGAGSAIADDVPDGALGISRPEQRNVEGFAEKHKRKAEQEPEND